MMKIIVIGLGPGNPKHLTREAQRYLNSRLPLYFRTMKHPSARYFALGGRKVCNFDHYYKQGSNFEEVYRAITCRLIRAVRCKGTICYAVPGHPAVGEATVERLLKICPPRGIKIQIVDGLSFLEPLLCSLKIDLLDGVAIYDALALERLKEPSRNHLVIAQVYNRNLASSIKLKLLQLYPADHRATVLQAAGMPGEKRWDMPLHELDRLDIFNHFSTIYLAPSESGLVGDLLEIMARLREHDGCPWDRQQTHHSLRQYLIEEAYEVVAAIDKADDQSLCEELGDLLLQVVFHSQIASEENRFDFTRVVESITEKLIRRHPHVFGQEKAEDPSQVKILWDQIKSDERNEEHQKFLLTVDHGLPALLKAYKLQKRAAEAGFDWPAIKGPLDKAREELLELEEACQKNDHAAIEDELGDYLFTAVNLARFLKVNPELALGKTIGRFIDRFQYVIDQTEKAGRPLTSFSLDELDQWWEEAKNFEKKSERSRNPLS